MLRPATPLSVLLGVAFILLLLSVLSAPVIDAIPLGRFQDVTFGVFGYCQAGKCSNVGLGYDVARLFSRGNQEFDLPDSARNTLASILVLHPVAAFLTLVMFIFAVATHFHSVSHSTRFLLTFFVFTLITFLVCLAALVVDILLFIPHLAWGTYIVLAATIMVFLSGVVSCAMRRTLVSRKSRKREIEENAEMSGENYYNRENNSAPKSGFVMTSQPALPMVSGANGNPDSLPAFSSYDNQKKDDQLSDERIPLTQRTTSERSAPSGVHVITSDIPHPAEVGVALGGPARSASADRFGKSDNVPVETYEASRSGAYDRMNSAGRRSAEPNHPAGGQRGGRGGWYTPPYMRGRGGHATPGRGAYGPRGGRGGSNGPPGPPGRGGYGQGGSGNMGRGGRPQPPGYNNMGGSYPNNRRAYTDPPPQHDNPHAPVLDQAGNQVKTGGHGGYIPYTPSYDLPRAESPPPLNETESTFPIGQAVEMDATPATEERNMSPYGQVRDSDTDVAGMVGLQMTRPERNNTEGRRYEEEQYKSPRAAWERGPGRNSPKIMIPPQATERQPVETISSNAYYEDVDPRFDQSYKNQNQYLQPPGEGDYEAIRAGGSGSRSPADSERSNFTSISQRGVNPQWDPQRHQQQQYPPMPPPHSQGPPIRRPVQQRHDVILDNPDFAVPGGRSAAAGQRGNQGLIPGSAYPSHPL